MRYNSDFCDKILIKNTVNTILNETKDKQKRN